MEEALCDAVTRLNYKATFWQPYSTVVAILCFRKLNETVRQLKLNTTTAHFFNECSLWFTAVSIFSSNKIEDTGLPIEQTYHLVAKALEGESLENIGLDIGDAIEESSKREVLQHAAAYNYLCIEKKGDQLSSELILETHRIIARDMVREDGFVVPAGEYRKGDVTVGRAGQPCLRAEKVPEAIHRIIQVYNESAKTGDPIAAAAKLKFDFIHLHPFDDGNGRVSRLLLNWALLSSGFPFPISLQVKFSYKSKKNYFGTLTDASDNSFLASLVLESCTSVLGSVWERARLTFGLSKFRLPQHQEYQPYVYWKKWGIDLNDVQEDYRSLVLKFKKIRPTLITSADIDEIVKENIVAAALYSRKPVSFKSFDLVGAIVRLLDGCDVDSLEYLPPVTSDHNYHEILGFVAAYRLLCVDNLNKPLSTSLIKKTLSLINGLPENEVYRSVDLHSEAHLFPKASIVPSAMDRFLVELNSYDKSDPIVYAATVMYEIIAIHPSQDGNGRLARLVLNWALLSEGIPFPVSFAAEGSVSNGRKALTTAAMRSRQSAGNPSLIASRILISLVNSYNRFFEKQEKSGMERL